MNFLLISHQTGLRQTCSKMAAHHHAECLWSLEENGVRVRGTVTKHTDILLFEIVSRNEEIRCGR